MKKSPLLLLACALATLGGTAAYEWGALTHERQELALEQKRTASLQRQLAAARAQAANSIAPAPPAEAAATPEATREATLRAQIDPWLLRVRRLRESFAQNREQRIPELALLTDEDWLALARGFTDVDSEIGLRKARAAVRNNAASRFAEAHLRPALRAFLQNSNDVLPADIGQLASYLRPPADATMLARWELRASGRVNTRGEVIAERAPIDDEFDIRVAFSLSGGGSGPWGIVFMRLAAEDAQRAFSAANPGQRAGEEEVLPYIRDPIAHRIFSALVSYQRDNHGVQPANLAQLRPYVTDPAALAKLEQIIRANQNFGR